MASRRSASALALAVLAVVFSVNRVAAAGIAFSFSGGGGRSAAATNTVLEAVKESPKLFAKVSVIAGVSGGCWGVTMFCANDGRATQVMKNAAKRSGQWAEMKHFTRTNAAKSTLETLDRYTFNPYRPVKELTEAFEQIWNPGNRQRLSVYNDWVTDMNAEVFLNKPSALMEWEPFAEACKIRHKVDPQCMVGSLTMNHDLPVMHLSVLSKPQIMFTSSEMITSLGQSRTQVKLPKKIKVESSPQRNLLVTDVAAMSSSAWTFVTGPIRVSFDQASAVGAYDLGILCNLPFTGDWHQMDAIFLFDNSEVADGSTLWTELDRCIPYWKDQHGGTVTKLTRLQLELPEAPSPTPSPSPSPSASPAAPSATPSPSGPESASTSSSTATEPNQGSEDVKPGHEKKIQRNPSTRFAEDKEEGEEAGTPLFTHMHNMLRDNSGRVARGRLLSAQEAAASTKTTIDSCITPLTVSGWANVKIYHVPLTGLIEGAIAHRLSAQLPTFKSGFKYGLPAPYTLTKLKLYDFYRDYITAFVIGLLEDRQSST